MDDEFPVPRRGLVPGKEPARDRSWLKGTLNLLFLRADTSTSLNLLPAPCGGA